MAGGEGGCSELKHVPDVTSGLVGNGFPISSLEVTLSTGGGHSDRPIRTWGAGFLNQSLTDTSDVWPMVRT